MNVFVNKDCRHVYFEEGEFETPEFSSKLLELAADSSETVRLHLERSLDLDMAALAVLSVFAREMAGRGLAVDLAAAPEICALLSSAGLDQVFTRMQAAS